MDNQGGMAAVLNVDSNLADFATFKPQVRQVQLVWCFRTRAK
jgi:hypothetical protein